MLRIIVHLPTRRSLLSARTKSTTALSQAQRLRNMDNSLAAKFNLASLNGGKNPFETPSERLLRPPTKKPKNDAEMRDVYSLAYLMGKETTPIPKEKKLKKNPFDVASAKLM